MLTIIFGEHGLSDLYNLKQKRDQMVETNKKMERDNLSLYNEIDRLQHDPDLIENIARKELGMIRETEVIFQIKDNKRSDE